MPIHKNKAISALLAVAIAMMLMLAACADTGTKTPDLPGDSDVQNPLDPAGPGNDDPAQQEPVYPPLSQVPHPSQFEGRLTGNDFVEFVIKEDGGLYSFVRPDGWEPKDFTVPLGREYDETAGEPVKILDNVSYIYAPYGNLLTAYPDSRVAYAITESGELYAWGQLPDGSQQVTPLKITDNVAQVAHGFAAQFDSYHNPLYILKKDGRLYRWTGEYNEGNNFVTDHVVNIRYIEAGFWDHVDYGYNENPVWITKDDGNTYYYEVFTGYSQIDTKELVRIPIANISIHCDNNILTLDGKVFTISFYQFQRPLLLAVNIVQLGSVFNGGRTAVTADGKVFILPSSGGWHIDEEVLENVFAGVYQIDENCFWFALSYIGISDEDLEFFTIDPDGGLWKTICTYSYTAHSYKKKSKTLIDENVCYANKSYYIKTDGSLWYVNDSLETTKIMDGVMIPQ